MKLLRYNRYGILPENLLQSYHGIKCPEPGVVKIYMV